MPAFGKPYATGRSSGKLTGSDRKWRSPPKGEPWAWLTRELLCSPAWRAQGPNCRRLIDFLLIEHTNHAGTENGATSPRLQPMWPLPFEHVCKLLCTCAPLKGPLHIIY